VPKRQDPAAKTRAQALQIATAVLEKKGFDVQILDVVGRVDYADFVVVASGRSDRHVAAIVQGIEESLKKSRSQLLAIEGLAQSVWVLVDTGDVIAHVFQESVRGQYDIEGLWMDAPRVPTPDDVEAD
jgi:ribosome-associated protein